MNKAEFDAFVAQRSAEIKALALAALAGQLPPNYIATDDVQIMYGNAMLRIKPEFSQLADGDRSIHFRYSPTYSHPVNNGKVNTKEYQLTEERIIASCDINNGSVWQTETSWSPDGTIQARIVGGELAAAVRESVSKALSRSPFVDFSWRCDEHDKQKYHLYDHDKKVSLAAVWKSGNQWGTMYGTSHATLAAAKAETERREAYVIEMRHVERLAALDDKLDVPNAPGADGRIFGYTVAQIGAMQGCKMKDDLACDPELKSRRDREDVEARAKLVAQQRVENAARINEAIADPRIKVLHDAGLPDTQVLQAAKELREGDDELVRDLARIYSLTLPEASPDLSALDAATALCDAGKVDWVRRYLPHCEADEAVIRYNLYESYRDEAGKSDELSRALAGIPLPPAMRHPAPK